MECGYKNIVFLIKETLNEVLGKFDLNQFKKLSWDEKHNYAEKHLPHLGTGSSRIVFALSGNKVLKLSLDHEKGPGQNEAEVDVYSNPITKPIISKIYDFDNQNYEWVISEIAKPFKNEEEFESKAGISINDFRNIDLYNSIENFIKTQLDLQYKKYYDIRKYLIEFGITVNSPQEALESLNKLIRNIEIGESTNYNAYFIIKDYFWILEKYKNTIVKLQSPKTKNILNNLIIGIKVLKKIGLISADIYRYDHFGTTADNRIVLIDYGATEDVMQKYYY